MHEDARIGPGLRRFEQSEPCIGWYHSRYRLKPGRSQQGLCISKTRAVAWRRTVLPRGTCGVPWSLAADW